MRKLVSLFLTAAILSVVPTLAAAELSVPDSCCASSGDMTMMNMNCCAMASCSMSSQPEPVRTPHHRGTMTESGQTLPAPELTTTVSSVLFEPHDSAWLSEVLVDPSPPPTTSERLATISTYLI